MVIPRAQLLRAFMTAPLLAALSPVAAGAVDAVDGFVAACTGNLDGTGQCVNQETGSRYTCLIIPGQVIDCKSRTSRAFQCVWISGVQANYAEFWCDPEVDALLRNELSAKQLDQPFKDTTSDTIVVPPTQSSGSDPFREEDGGALKDRFKDSLNP